MGLRDKAVDLIKGIKNATTGRLLVIWEGVRTVASAFSLRIGGHPQFIRPLINPMAQVTAIAKYGDIDEDTEDEIKGMVAATENYGNFFAQNCFMGASGTLLIVATLNELFKSHGIDQVVTANRSHYGLFQLQLFLFLLVELMLYGSIRNLIRNMEKEANNNVTN